ATQAVGAGSAIRSQTRWPLGGGASAARSAPPGLMLTRREAVVLLAEPSHHSRSVRFSRAGRRREARRSRDAAPRVARGIGGSGRWGDGLLPDLMTPRRPMRTGRRPGPTQSPAQVGEELGTAAPRGRLAAASGRAAG